MVGKRLINSQSVDITALVREFAANPVTVYRVKSLKFRVKKLRNEEVKVRTGRAVILWQPINKWKDFTSER